MTVSSAALLWLPPPGALGDQRPACLSLQTRSTEAPAPAPPRPLRLQPPAAVMGAHCPRLSFPPHSQAPPHWLLPSPPGAHALSCLLQVWQGLLFQNSCWGGIWSWIGTGSCRVNFPSAGHLSTLSLVLPVFPLCVWSLPAQLSRLYASLFSLWMTVYSGEGEGSPTCQGDSLAQAQFSHLGNGPDGAYVTG